MISRSTVRLLKHDAQHGVGFSDFQMVSDSQMASHRRPCCLCSSKRFVSISIITEIVPFLRSQAGSHRKNGTICVDKICVHRLRTPLTTCGQPVLSKYRLRTGAFQIRLPQSSAGRRSACPDQPNHKQYAFQQILSITKLFSTKSPTRPPTLGLSPTKSPTIGFSTNPCTGHQVYSLVHGVCNVLYDTDIAVFMIPTSRSL